VNTRSLRFRITAWYAGLLAGALLVFGVSVYLGLERYLYWNLQRTLVSDCRTIGTELLAQLPEKQPAWLAADLNEDYAPEGNSKFMRVIREGTGVIYLSGAPKDGTFDPSQVSFPTAAETGRARKIRLAGRHQLLVEALEFTTPDGSRFIVESGMPSQKIEVVLRGLLWTFAIYIPLIILLAVGSGYWLMRRSLQPVDEITRRAEGITSTNLSERLPVIRTGDELERLSTALNRMIERLDEAFQHIHRFSGDASHELRTPLTILQLELEGIAQNNRLNPALSEQIGSALEETHRMSHIVESLLAISRLDAGEVKMDKTSLDLGELAASIADQMRLLAEEKSIRLTCKSADEVCVEGDRSRLQQVIVNLVANAIKYTQEGGTVEVRVRRKGDTAVLEVSDNGPGIPADALAHIFERFYRADKARSRNSGGAGLGLAIVKAICAAHGADVYVSSQEGKGSTFSVALPLLPVTAGNEATPVLRKS
jgi:two-component system, OmpR family, sensor kinase